MKSILILLAVTLAANALHLAAVEHVLGNMAMGEEHVKEALEHLQAYFNGQTSAAPAPTNGELYVNGQPLTQIRNTYLSKLPQGPYVDSAKAYEMARFFGTPMGSTILRYFNSLTRQADGAIGLNIYNLSDKNFLLWMSIKIIAGQDTNMYARSMTIDRDLFYEFVTKSQKK